MNEDPQGKSGGAGIVLLFLFLLAQTLGLMVAIGKHWQPPSGPARPALKESADRATAAQADAKLKRDALGKANRDLTDKKEATVKAKAERDEARKEAEASEASAEKARTEAGATPTDAAKNQLVVATDRAAKAKARAEKAVTDFAAKEGEEAAATKAATRAQEEAKESETAAGLAEKADADAVAASSAKERALLIMVLLAGALGGALHALNSIVGYLGNRRFEWSWGWWYLVRAVIGAGLGITVFLAVRAGFMTSAVNNSDLNYFGFVAISLLTGFFNRNATAKLLKVAEALFTAVAPEGGPLKPQPVIAKLTPAKVTLPVAAPIDVEITGTGFASDASVTIDGKAMLATDVKFVSPTSVKVTLSPALIGAKGSRKIRVARPGSPESAAAELLVDDAAGAASGGPAGPANSPITIAQLTPSSVTLPLAGPVDLEIAGTGFASDSTVLVDGKALAAAEVKFVSATKLKATLTPAVVAAAGKRKICVAGAGGAQSAPADLDVK